VSGSPASLRKRWQQRREKLVAALAAIIAHGVATGEVRSDLPAEVLAQYLLGLMRTRAWEMDDWPDAMRSDEVVVDLFLNGVAARLHPRIGRRETTDESGAAEPQPKVLVNHETREKHESGMGRLPANRREVARISD